MEQTNTFGGKNKSCYLHITVIASEETFFYLYAEKNSENIMLFPDIG